MTNIGLIIAIIKVGLMAVGFFNNQYETKAQNDIEESVYEYETESEDENVTINLDNAKGQYALEYGVYLSKERGFTDNPITTEYNADGNMIDAEILNSLTLECLQ